MFTGLIETIGSIEAIEERGAARLLNIGVADGSYLADVELGESIAVNGVCLTVTAFEANQFTAEAIEETMRRTTLGGKVVGSRVNLERALKANARLGGHIVQGHVDGVGTVVGSRSEGEGWWTTFEPSSALMKYVVEKGSICIDGVSLTVANVSYSKFSVALIPHTREVTIAGDWEPGANVNLEVDIVAKYVERMTLWTQQQAG
jgi:riboflavin synthase